MKQPKYTVENHELLVRDLNKSGLDILSEITHKDTELLHVSFALGIEVGELCDPIKKYLIYRKPLDRENVIEELGDIEFYLEAIRQNLGITRDETISGNISKLTKRYNTGTFTNDQAITRADKP